MTETTKDRITKRTTKGGEVRYDVRIRIAGKPLKKTFVRRAAADAWLRQMLADDLRGVALDPKLAKVSFAEYSAAWLSRGGTRGHLAPKTHSYYSDLLRLHIGPTFNTMAIGAIRTEQVRDWLNVMRKDKAKLAPKCYRLLSTILQTAVNDKRIGSNPCSIPGAGVETSAERPLVSPADARDLADAMTGEWRCAILLAEFAQLRLGEILGLQVGDIQVADRSVRIERQALELSGVGRMVTDPKTDAGKRIVSLPDGLVAELVAHVGEYCRPGPESWLFANAAGRPWYRWEWHQAWTGARDAVNTERVKAGVTGLPDGLHMHDLRHSGLTYVAHSGVTTKELMRRGGHASPTAALRYQHQADGRDREIADALGRLFDAPREPTAKVLPFRPRHQRAMGADSS